ncbi:MAG: putative transport system ATP-binding protein [Patescibacteria group bacterium]|nr:putative transport system ATP-binding protein [Patescibacteria group bacterium]
MKKEIIKVRNLVKEFKDGEKITKVLKGVNLDIFEGEFVAIMGRSGAGKSTCMYQLSLLDEPSSGEIIIDNANTHNMKEGQRSEFRLKVLGYVFQDYSLIPELSALENVSLPLMQMGHKYKDASKVAEKSLDQVGLGHRLGNLPSELSGGEQQRVAIARAIAHKPKILFADEPTANLDIENSDKVINIFKKLNKEEGLTIVMVTHEEEYKDIVDKVISLSDGLVVND